MLLLITGILFHYSAIIGIIILLVEMLPKISKKHLLIIFILAFSAKIIFPLARLLVLRLLPMYAGYFYLAAFQGEEMRTYSLLMIILRSLCCIFIHLFVDAENKGNRGLIDMCYYSNVAIFFTLMLTDTIMAQRFGYYFEFFIILLIPRMIKQFKYKNLIYLFAFAFGWAFFIFELSKGAQEIVPYQFFWQ